MMNAKENKVKINILYTNIGRGHPFYLDGLLEMFIKRGQLPMLLGSKDVFEISEGAALRGWQIARWLYRKGSSKGIIGSIYGRIRAGSNYNRPSRTLEIMGKDIRQRYFDDAKPLIVAHPTLVAVLKNKKDLIYQHGELVTPKEAVVRGAAKVLVPTEESARPFYDGGYTPNELFISGLCIEPSLVKTARDNFLERTARFKSTASLTGAFFSSGAEPKHHVNKLVRAIYSAVRVGGRVMVFARADGILEKKTENIFKKHQVPYNKINTREPFPSEPYQALIVTFTSRREENHLTSKLFPFFDYFMAPSHERTNWALGLGLPMFIIGPAVGPFASLNKALLMEHGVAKEINNNYEAEKFGALLLSIHESGMLEKMSGQCWGRYEIDGFEKIVNYLVENFRIK